MNIGYPQATRAGKELARPAPPGPTLPQRTDAPWCAFCGMTTGHWTGCPGPRESQSHTRSPGKLEGHTSAPRDSLQLPGVLDRKPVKEAPDVR